MFMASLGHNEIDISLPFMYQMAGRAFVIATGVPHHSNRDYVTHLWTIKMENNSFHVNFSIMA